MAAITFKGEELIAKKQAAKEVMEIDQIVLANIPGLDPTKPVDRNEQLPSADKISLQAPVSQSGYINPNLVVYSLMLTTGGKSFDFNWIGLYSSKSKVVVAISYLPVQTKSPQVAMTRNFMIEYSGAKETGDIKIDAKSWQVDFSARMNGIDERGRVLRQDTFGRSLFYGDTCKVTKDSSGYYNILKGTSGIVGGIKFPFYGKRVLIDVVPNKVWLDVSCQGNAISDVKPYVDVVISNNEKTDYVDSNGVNHYVCNIANIENSVIIDNRIVASEKNNHAVRHDEVSMHTHKKIEDAKNDTNINRYFIKILDFNGASYKRADTKKDYDDFPSSEGEAVTKFTDKSGIKWIYNSDNKVRVIHFSKSFSKNHCSKDSINAAHKVGNYLNLCVSYDGIGSYGLSSDAGVVINTNVDFAGAKLYVINGIHPNPDFSTIRTMYIVFDPESPLEQLSGAVSAENLKKGSVTPTKGIFDTDGFVLLECNFKIPDRKETGTTNYQQAFKTYFDGRVSQPLAVDLTDYASNIRLKVRRQSKTRIKLSHINVIDTGWNNQRILDIQRNNVESDGLTVKWKSAREATHSLIRIYMSADVDVHNCKASGTPRPGGGYIFEICGGAEIYTRGHTGSGLQGQNGNNFVNGWYLDRCALNRVDIHESGFNVYVTNSVLYEIGLFYGWGGGVLSVKNCKCVRGPAIRSRPDYGTQFFGSMIVSDVEFSHNLTQSLYVIDMLNNPLGASVDTVSVETITISNITRASISAPGSSEIVPVAMKVKENITGKVIAPTSIVIDTINSTDDYSFGLILDFANMERAPGTYDNRVSISNSTPSHEANVNKGIKDMPSNRKVINEASINLTISDCSFVYINMNVTIYSTKISNSSVSGVVFASKKPQFLQVVGSIFRNPVGGTESKPTPIGAPRKPPAGNTVIKDCEFHADFFTIENAAAITGCNFRNGSKNVKLPTGVTFDTAFSGWKHPTSYK